MRLKILLLLTAAFSYTLAADDVLVFTDSNFDFEVAKREIVLVKFYAPWCGHCKKLAPEYERAAYILKKSDPPIALAKVDCTVETNTCSKYKVNGYPTLKVFKKGEFSKDYDGPRETDEIVKKMNRESGPVSRQLDSLEDARNFLSKDTIGIIGFFESNTSDEAKAFLKVADQMGHLRFAHTSSDDVKRELNQTEYAVVIYRPKILQTQFEEAEVRTTEIRTVKLKAFLDAEALGLCAERTQMNAVHFGKPLVVAYYDVDYVKNPKGTNYWRNRVMKVGRKLRDEGAKVYFGVSSREEMSRELDECGFEDTSGDKPHVCIWDQKNKRYRMNQPFSMESLEQFIRDFLFGKIDPYIKSEPIPESNDEPVKVVVAKTFDEIVRDDMKDVLIEFYAPWCGHCKNLAPKYEELAKMLKDESSIVIAKMDATANDVLEPYEVNGFPTIYFSPKDRKDSPVRYDGEREVKDLLKFVAKEATSELIAYNREGKKKSKKKKTKEESDKTEL